jgi:hypothetical protein
VASKCIYPYPTLVIRDAIATTGTDDIRLSFYQPEGKPWDWQRAKRLADQCYPQGHGEIEIEHAGEIHCAHDAVEPKRRAPPASYLLGCIRQYLAGDLSREALQQLAA